MPWHTPQPLLFPTLGIYRSHNNHDLYERHDSVLGSAQWTCHAFQLSSAWALIRTELSFWHTIYLIFSLSKWQRELVVVVLVVARDAKHKRRAHCNALSNVLQAIISATKAKRATKCGIRQNAICKMANVGAFHVNYTLTPPQTSVSVPPPPTSSSSSYLSSLLYVSGCQ